MELRCGWELDGGAFGGAGTLLVFCLFWGWGAHWVVLRAYS